MALKADHSQHLRESFQRLVGNWKGFKRRACARSQGQQTPSSDIAPILNELSNWGAQVVEAFSIDRFPNYILEPPEIRECSTLAERLTGASDERQAGLRVILWTALFHSPDLAGTKYLNIPNPFECRIRDWFVSLFDLGEESIAYAKMRSWYVKEITPKSMPIEWVSVAFQHLLDYSPLVEIKGNEVFVRGRKMDTSPAEFRLITKLFERSPSGFTKGELDNATGNAGSVTLLKDLRKKDSAWEEVIILPGGKGQGGYRLRKS